MAKDRNKQKRLQKKRAKKAAKRKDKAKVHARARQREVELPALLRRQDPVTAWDQTTGLAGLAELLSFDLEGAARVVDDYISRGLLKPIPQLWYPARVAELPLDALIEAVGAHGVHVDQESFVATAAVYRGARKLVRGAWHHEGAAPTTRDLFDLAATRFWAEWVPDRASEEELEDLYGDWAFAVEEVGMEGAHPAWMSLWERARTTFTSEDHDLLEWSHGWDRRGGLPYDIEEVCQSVEDAGAVPWAEEALALVTEVLARFPLPVVIHELILAGWVHASIALGRRAEAETELAVFRAENPSRALPYVVQLELEGILATDADPAKVAERVAWLRDALPGIDPDDRDQIVAALRELGADPEA